MQENKQCRKLTLLPKIEFVQITAHNVSQYLFQQNENTMYKNSGSQACVSVAYRPCRTCQLCMIASISKQRFDKVELTFKIL